jgi:hypothetical protein
MAARSAQAERRMKQLERAGRIQSSEAGVVLFAGSERRGKATGREGALTISLVAREVPIEIRADVLLDIVRAELLALYRQQIMQGRKPDGGPQPRLGKSASQVQDRKGGRGFRTGFLADNLRSPKMTGTTASARARILPPTKRNVFIASEAARGIFYLLIGADAERSIQEMVDAFLTKIFADAAGVGGRKMEPAREREAKEG